MPWGAVAGAVIGGVASSNSASKGAKATAKASKQATALEREQFERGIQEVAPFRQVGVNALTGLQDAATAQVDPFAFQDSSSFLNNYFTSPEFQALNAQATDQILRNRSATGGLRSGGSNADLATIAPTIGIDALNRSNQQDLQAYGVNQGAITDRFNRLFGVAGMGANVASGNQTAGANFASQAGANAIGAGNAQAAAYQQQGQAIAGLGSDLGGLYTANKLGFFDRQNQGKI